MFEYFVLLLGIPGVRQRRQRIRVELRAQVRHVQVGRPLHRRRAQRDDPRGRHRWRWTGTENKLARLSY